MNLEQALAIIWARRRIALLVMLLAILIGTVGTLLWPKQYTASVAVLVDVKTDPILGMVLPAMAMPNYVTTQTDIITSDRVAQNVVRLLHFDQSAQAVERWKEATQGEIPLEAYYSTLLQKGLTVSVPPRGGNVLSISYAGAEPKFAAAVANAFAKAYIDVNVELRVEPARQYTAWFDERMKVLRANLQTAQSRLSDYQKAKGIVAADIKLDEETGRLNALMGELAHFQADRANAMGMQRNTGTEVSPDVMQSPVIQNIKAELAKQEASLAEISSNVGENHPQRKQLEAQIAGLKVQLSQEIGRISGGAYAANRYNASKEEELKAEIAAQKKHVLELGALHDEVSLLVQDVETAQKAYDAVAQRMNEESLESHSEQANLSILSPAVAPTEPSLPRVPINILLSVVLGVALGIASAFVAEYRDRRVRVIFDLADLAGVPLLAELRNESTRTSFFRRLIGGGPKRSGLKSEPAFSR